MKYMLLFPPSWTTTQPYLSLPALTAYLRKQGHEVAQRDLNLEFAYCLFQPYFLKALYEDVEESFEEDNELHSVFRIIKDDIIENGEKYISDLKNEKLFLSTDTNDIDKYKKAQNMLNYIFKLISFKYQPQVVTLNSYDVGVDIVNTEKLLKYLTRLEENMFYNFYTEIVAQNEVFSEVNIVGISIIGQEQLIPGLVLAKLIKKMYPNIAVCVGGPIITRLKSSIEENSQFFSIFDFAIMFEGEYPLSALSEALEGKKEFKDVPNLIYYSKIEDKVCYSFTENGLAMEEILTPDFDGLELEKYLTPRTSLPLLTTRGCYWNKCSFCDHSYIYNNNFRIRRTEDILADINTLRKKHGVEYINFVDECIPPKVFKELANLLSTLPFKIFWHGAIRFEKALVNQELLKKAYDSGLRVLFYGFESGCQRILDLMNKGTNCSEIEKVLEATSNVGIWNHLFAIFGFPTESMDEFQMTKKFIEKNKKYINSVGFARFSLNKSSPVAHNPHKYSVNDMNLKGELSLHLDYQCEYGLSKKELKDIQKQNEEKGFPTLSQFQYFTQVYHRDLWYIYLSEHKIDELILNFDKETKKTDITEKTNIILNDNILINYDQLKRGCIVFNPLEGKLLELSESTKVIFNRLHECISIEKLAYEVSEINNIAYDSLYKELTNFINELIERNIIEIMEEGNV